MKNLFQILAMLALFISIESFGQKTWTGATSTAWNTATNWSPAGIPIATDNVIIPSAPVNQPLVSGTLTPVCNNLTINSGASLTINGTTSSNALLTASGSTIIYGSLSVGSAITHFGTLTVNNITWASGSSMSGAINGGVNVSGNWEFATGSAVSMGYSTVTFTGSANSNITSNSANSNFYGLTINKTGGASVNIITASTSSLTINGAINIGSGAVLNGQADITTILKGNLTNAGNIYMNAGTLSFERTSGTQSVQINTNDYFNSLNINTGGTVSITTSYYMQLMGSLTIQSGVFNPNGNLVALWGNWTNNVGPDAFVEGTGTVSFNGGNYHQYCTGETFNILEVNKTLGGALRVAVGTVTCAQYDWTAGAVDVGVSGTFTALDLADDGIRGSFYVNPGCTINLYQDASQSGDLGGNLTFTDGGTINIYGGLGSVCHWPANANASITMNDGELNFADRGILIQNNATYTFTTNITGGTIKTAKDFTNIRTGFALTAGTLEMVGTTNNVLACAQGSLFNLKINKGSTGMVTLNSNAIINGLITIESGTFLANGKVISAMGGVTVNNGGVLWIENSAQLQIGNTKSLLVNEGGAFRSIGLPLSRNRLTHFSGYFEVQIHGTIAAIHTIFEYNYGLNVWGSATVDLLYPFDYCTFQNGTDRLLLFGNNQELLIRGASFPTATAVNNVWKNNDAGRVNFKDATGAFTGPAYELDPYNRIDWSTTQPGLWTGAISTDWNIAGNWDDLLVPTITTDVVIPATAPNMPIVGNANAVCNSLTVNGMLTIANRTLETGTAIINGNLSMNHYLGVFKVNGNITWNSGSTASISAMSTIRVKGDWTYNTGANVQLTNGSVYFEGFTFTRIYNYDDNSSFNEIYVAKTESSSLSFDAGSTYPIRVKNFYVDYNSEFYSNAAQNINVTGNFYSFSTTQLVNGAIVFEGSNHIFIPHPDAFYHDIIFNHSGTVTLNQTNTNMLDVRGDIVINSGIFNAENSIIKLGGSWINNVGESAFNETGSRVIFNGVTPQFCSTEAFNILEIDKSVEYFYDMTGSNISCQVYDWTQGGLWIAGGSSFYAADLADNGIYGNFVLWSDLIELHQDATQSIDLHGTLSINGGEFKVYGGMEQSYWGSNANASLTMYNGVLDFVDQAISIYDQVPYSFTSTISGGIIRSQKGFIAQSAGFNPTGGTVEIYGNQNSLVAAENGAAFYNLIMNKSPLPVVCYLHNALVNNSLSINNGTVIVPFGNTLGCANIAINEGGDLRVSNSVVKLKNGGTFNVNYGGYFYTEGYDGALSTFTGITPADRYSFQVNSGGWMSANYTVFENMGGQGIFIAPGAILNLSDAFNNCEFRMGLSGPNPLLTINNSQDVYIENAIFPANSWGGQYNVRKSMDAGSVTFINAGGQFAGESFEDDPYNRIHWGIPKQLNLTLFLEGLYNGPNSMRQANDENGPHFVAGIADEIRVEFRSGLDYYEMEYFVDHVLLGTNGQASIDLPAFLSGDYYITIRHRNSIETTTPVPVSFASGIINYSFDAPSKAYGGNLLQMITGQYVIYGGDVNQDGYVDTGDMTPVDNGSANFESGYLPTDVNGDGFVDTGDITIIDNNSAGFVGAVTP
jgi:hypothetical protein